MTGYGNAVASYSGRKKEEDCLAACEKEEFDKPAFSRFCYQLMRM